MIPGLPLCGAPRPHNFSFCHLTATTPLSLPKDDGYFAGPMFQTFGTYPQIGAA